MGVERDTLIESENEQKGQAYSDLFRTMCPYYLSIGMTWKQYWDDDCGLTVYYREAEELRNKRRNEQAWLQGMYIYDALGRLSPIFQIFGKGQVKARPYVESPYPITEEERIHAQRAEEERNAAKAKAYMMATMQSINRSFAKGDTE